MSPDPSFLLEGSTSNLQSQRMLELAMNINKLAMNILITQNPQVKRTVGKYKRNTLGADVVLYMRGVSVFSNFWKAYVLCRPNSECNFSHILQYLGVLENVQYCGGKPEQASTCTGYYVTDE